jgi:AP-4 complex subunit beta-1
VIGFALRVWQLMKNINVERDPKRKREVIKKVIAYMTLGIDVSR